MVSLTDKMMASVGDFGLLNTSVLLLYLVGMLAIGLALAGRQQSTEDYFLAGRRMPWLAVGMSMFASLTSATTVMGVPAFAYRHNIAMLFGVAMSLVVAPILACLFYPLYRRLHVTTSYEYILCRYGPAARYAVSVLFVLGRMGWLAIVIYAPAKAIAVAAGLPLGAAIGVMGLLAVTYTALGGVSAVIWTDVVQFLILVGGMVWLAIALIGRVPDGAAGILHIAAEAGKLSVFDWRDWSKLTALSAMVGWFFLFLNDYGTDQVTVQRLMAVRGERGVAKAIAFNAVNDLLINGLLIFIGIGVFAYYRAYPARLGADLDADGILPHFIMVALPAGVSGLMVTAIFAAAMSSVDSGINSVATVIVSDLVRPLRLHSRSDRSDLRLARGLTLLLGAMATTGALLAARIGGIVRMWMTVMGFSAAPVLSLFLLGILTRRTHFRGWLVGLVCGMGLNLWLKVGLGDRLMEIWLFPASFLMCTCVSYGVSLLISRPESDERPT